MIRTYSSLKKLTFLLLSGVLLFCSGLLVQAQTYDSYSSRAIGGVAVDQGMVKNAPKELSEALKQEALKKLQEIPAGLDQVSASRKVSMKKLDLAIAESVENGTPLPDAVRYLGGLTSIQYVIAVPEENDIILVGAGEGWTVSDSGTIVGSKTGKPTLLLENLVTVFRAWNTSQPELISCSIDPTPEGRLRVRNANLGNVQSPKAKAEQLRELLGNQIVTLTGVPEDSRFASVMVAADYRMKRIGLKLDPAPVSRFPSYLEMVKGTNSYSAPRFWMAPEFKQMKHDSSKLVWDMGGVQVKTLTAREYLDRSGNRTDSAPADEVAVRWAEMMTTRYDELAAADDSFAELKNCMDIAGVVALVYLEQLHTKTNCPLNAILDSEGLKLPSYNVPKMVATDCALVSVRGNKAVVGCGGVEVNPVSAITAAKQDDALAGIAQTMQMTGENWWSN